MISYSIVSEFLLEQCIVEFVRNPSLEEIKNASFIFENGAERDKQTNKQTMAKMSEDEAFSVWAFPFCSEYK